MGKLTVKRVRSFMSSIRKFKVILDGEIIGYIENGETKTFDIPEGEHVIQSGISLINGMSKKLKMVQRDDSLVVVKINPIMWVIFIFTLICGINFGLLMSNGHFSLLLLIVIIILAILGMFFALSIKQEK